MFVLVSYVGTTKPFILFQSTNEYFNILVKSAVTNVMKKCVVRLLFKLSNPFSTILFYRLKAEFIFSDSVLKNSKQKVIISCHNNRVSLIVLP